MEVDGKTVRMGKDGAAPTTLALWRVILTSEFPGLHSLGDLSGGGSILN